MEKNQIKTPSKYYTGIGRRKTSTASIRLFPKGQGQFLINDKKIEAYFPENILKEKIYSPLKLTNLINKVDIIVLTSGGGKTGQAEAIRHGLARALQKFDINLRKTLKVAGFLTRDARIKERKKPGLKRARKAPQWAKR